MGLGKTLTMISLIAADQGVNTSATSGTQHAESDIHQPGATLIVVPPPRECSLGKRITKSLKKSNKIFLARILIV